MKDGIHLGPPPVRFPWFGTALVIAASAAAVILLGLVWSAHLEVLQLREELGASGAAVAAPSSASVDRERDVRSRLQSVLDSGLLVAVPPTDVLRLLEQALPEGVSLRRLSLDATPPRPNLTLEALARDEDAVTRLQRDVAGASMVSATRLLEERRTPDGAVIVRLQVDLVGPAAP